MKIIYLLILIAFCISCSKDKEIQIDQKILKSVANSNRKFAFIQFPSEEENYYKWANHFGDIYVYNILDSTVVRYTNDIYYEESLSWSPDGDRLLFASSRDVFNPRTDDNSQAFHNLSLFILDLETGDIKPTNIHTPNISALAWLNEGIYFALFGNKIYKTDENYQTLEVVLELDASAKIWNFVASNNEKYLSLDIAYDYYGSERLGLFNIDTKAFEEFSIKCDLGGWELDNKSFFILRKDSLFTFDILSKKICYLPLMGNNDSLRIFSCERLNKDEVIQRLGNNYYSPFYSKSIRDVRENLAIGIENLQTNKVWYPIRSEYSWSGISVFGGLRYQGINLNLSRDY